VLTPNPSIFAANKTIGMNVKNNILETIGNTPLVRLNKITKELLAMYMRRWNISTREFHQGPHGG
jgi:hypothetical protein